jgi:hypothetical protein
MSEPMTDNPAGKRRNSEWISLTLSLGAPELLLLVIYALSAGPAAWSTEQINHHFRGRPAMLLNLVYWPLRVWAELTGVQAVIGNYIFLFIDPFHIKERKKKK